MSGRIVHRPLYKSAQVGSYKVELGSVVLLEAEEAPRQASTAAAAAAAGAAGQAAAAKQQHEQYVFGLVQCLWQDEDGNKMAQVGWGRGGVA